jgi:hypothetical protein
MLFEAGEPLQNPVLLQARVAVPMAMLEERTSAVARLQGERDACAPSAIRFGRNAIRPLPRSTNCS